MDKHKHLRRLTGILIALVIVLALSFVLLRNSKPVVIAYVQRNHGELTEFSQAAMEHFHDPQVRTYRGWTVDCFPGGNIVQFTVSSFGLGPSASYQGFYYSPQDVPLGFQGTDVTLEAANGGWQWTEQDGSNWGKTEKITDHWYWFEAHF